MTELQKSDVKEMMSPKKENDKRNIFVVVSNDMY